MKNNNSNHSDATNATQKNISQAEYDNLWLDRVKEDYEKNLTKYKNNSNIILYL